MHNLLFSTLLAGVLATGLVQAVPVPQSQEQDGPESAEPALTEKVYKTRVCPAIALQSKTWRFITNAAGRGWPAISSYRDQQGTPRYELTLLPDHRHYAAVMAMYKNRIQPPYEVSFEYQTSHDVGFLGAFDLFNDELKAADGVAFSFLINPALEDNNLPNGGSLGVSRKGGGYSLRLPFWNDNPMAKLLTAQGGLLDAVPFDKAYSDGQWVRMTVQITHSSIVVLAGESQQAILSVQQPLDTRYSAMAFSAGSGLGSAEHRIRNFCIAAPALILRQTEPKENEE